MSRFDAPHPVRLKADSTSPRENTGRGGSPTSIRLERVTKRFTGGVTAVDALDLEVHPGEFFSLLGPSGCGKTTTLRMIAGFEDADEGRILVGGRDLTHVPVHRRDMGMVFQSYALLPHRTVAENVAFGLRMRGVARAEIRTRVREALAQVALGGYEARKPSQLSGGQQQRVALARATVIRPAVLLCDEPLGALDRKLRQQMQVELKQLQRRLGVTLVFVTHDQEEALAMSDRIGIMNAGRLEQVGTPSDIYDRPATRFVAGFIGEINFVQGTMAGGRFGSRDGLTLPSPAGADGPATLAIRPEKVVLLRPGEGILDGTIVDASFLGDQVVYTVEAEGAGAFLVKERNAGDGALRPAASAVGLRWDASAPALIRAG